MPLSARFEEALVFAARLHAVQTRKGSDIPYVSHLLGVASLVLEHGGGEDEAIAALLHDAVEDQGGAPVRDEIARRFGPRVAAIVDACTESDLTPKPPWRERKERYLAQLAAADDAARLVALADKLHNARSVLNDYRLVGEALWDRFTAGRSGALWYFRQVTDLLSAAAPGPLADELLRTVAEVERLCGAGGDDFGNS